MQQFIFKYWAMNICTAENAAYTLKNNATKMSQQIS